MAKIDVVVVEVTDDMEVRKVETVEGTIKSDRPGTSDTTYRYLEIGFDDEKGDRHIFKDKDVEGHSDLYHRGDVGRLYLTITTEDVSKKDTTFVQERTKVYIKDFKKEAKS